MQTYRDIFYGRYFTNQAGKADPSAFREVFTEQKWFFRNEIVPLFPASKDVRVLDIGCGTGSLLAALKENGYKHVEGVDISEEQVEVAHAMGVSEVRQGNLNDLLKDAKPTYDVITGMDIIEHFTKDELTDLLLKIKNLLKPRGMVIFRTPNMDAPNASVFASGDFTHECLLNKSSAMQMMRSCGYREVDVRSGMIRIQNPLKEILRKVLWFFILIKLKTVLFASGRTWHQVVFGPNLIIMGKV